MSCLTGARADQRIAGYFSSFILDEAHRARRCNLVPGREHEAADPNNLLRFLREVLPRTRGLLLAGATPVQLHSIEAWDLLDALARGSDALPHRQAGGLGILRLGAVRGRASKLLDGRMAVPMIELRSAQHDREFVV